MYKMPYHTTDKPKQTKKKKKVVRLKKTPGMTQNQKDKLKEHSKHHSTKHMASMKKDMKNGMSFSRAHANALKKVGK